MTHPTEAELNDYVDGALDERSHAGIEGHVRHCDACRVEVDGLRALLSQAKSLPPGVDAPARLWSAVRDETIDRRLARRSLLWELRAPLAAAALLLVVAASGITWWLARGTDPAGVATVPAAGPAAAPTLAQAEADYVEAARRLLLVLEQRRERMDPVIVRAVEENLLVTGTAIAEAKAALDADPGNQSVAAILNATYQTRVRMLKRAVKLTGET